MSKIQSSGENITINADGANNDIKFQSNGSEVASIDQAGLVTATSFAGNGANLTSVPIADNAITLAKMASGTDGNIISYDASGNPVAIATGSDGQVLTSTGAGSPPAFEAIPAAGADISVDSWHLSLNSTTDVSSAADIDFSTTQHLGSNLSESGGVITVGTAGMYLVTYSAVMPGSPARTFDLNLYVNGSLVNSTYLYAYSADGYQGREVTVNLQLAATNTIKVRGVGHFYGNSQAMTRFIGTRIGD